MRSGSVSRELFVYVEGSSSGITIMNRVRSLRASAERKTSLLEVIEFSNVTCLFSFQLYEAFHLFPSTIEFSINAPSIPM